MTSENKSPGLTSLLRRLLTLAAIGVTFSASAALADPVSCSGTPLAFFPASDLSAFACETHSQTYSPSVESNTYGFDLYSDGFAFKNQLTFDTVLREFTLFMTAFYIDPGDPGDFLSRIPAGYHPETFMTTFGPSWIYFFVEDLQDTDAKPTQGVDYSGNWFQRVLWYGDGAYHNPQVLHDPRGEPRFFGNVITVPGSFDPEPTPCSEGPCDPPAPPPPCCIDFAKVPGDPVITGSADDFSGTIVVSVPEPGTLWLFGMAAAGAVTRLRTRVTRRRQECA